MSTVLTLISLQFKAGIRLPHGKNPLQTALKFTAVILGGAILLGGLVTLYYFIASEFVNEKGTLTDLRTEFLIFTLGGFQVIQTLFLIPMLIKVLDINNDRELLCKLPVSGTQIFISKVTVAYLFEIVFAGVILLPVLIAYGIAAAAGIGFYFFIPVLLLFVPALPFSLAVLVIFPLIKLTRFLQNKSLLTTVFYLGGLALGIILYMNIVQSAVYAIADEGFANALEKSAPAIKDAAKFIYPARMFANILDVPVATALLNAALVLVTSAALMAIALFVAALMYRRLYLTERVTISKPDKTKAFRLNGSSSAVFEKDVKNIFRSSNYTFQFLIIAVITPLLIYFSNRLAGYTAYKVFDRVGQVDRSTEMVFEVSLLIIMILLPLASSFAASNITREGHNIYHTKIIPVSFRKQLLIKAAIVFAPVFVSVAIGCFLTMLSYEITATHTVPGLSFTEVLMLLAISVPMAIGYICMGTYLDLRKPLCNQIGGQELTKSTAHTNFVLISGVGIGILFGVLIMLSAFSADLGVQIDAGVLRVSLTVFAFVFAAVNAVLLFIDGPGRYRRLEQ